MPQLNPGGKFVFGRSMICRDGTIQLPEQALKEHGITQEGKVCLFTGSKSTGGFCVTRKGLLKPSKLGHILTDLPQLSEYSANIGDFIHYKGRFYCWTHISEDGRLRLSGEMMRFLTLKPEMKLLSIRSSDIAFTMGAKGPLIERAERFSGEIPEY